MIRKPLNWSVKQICTMIDKGTIKFDNPIQRPAGQWSEEDKSLLIDSLLTLFVPDIHAIQYKNENNTNTYDIVDGKQRLTIIHDFYNNKFALIELEPIKIESTGEIFDISGKTFAELPEEVQEEIKSFTLTIKAIEPEEYDDEEALTDKIFDRINRGVRVSKEHSAFISVSKNIQEFTSKTVKEHKLFTEIAHYSPAAIKKSDREMTVLQTIMYLSNKEINSFATKDVERFFSENDITEDILALTIKAFDLMVTAFTEHTKFMSKINIPSMAKLIINNNRGAEFIQHYSKNSKVGDIYRNNCGAGNIKKEKVNGRITALQSLYEKYINENKKEIKEQPRPEVKADTNKTEIDIIIEKLEEEEQQEAMGM